MMKYHDQASRKRVAISESNLILVPVNERKGKRVRKLEGTHEYLYGTVIDAFTNTFGQEEVIVQFDNGRELAYLATDLDVVNE